MEGGAMAGTTGCRFCIGDEKGGGLLWMSALRELGREGGRVLVML